MKTHLYTLCWNEADMLEFFFRNYDPWVDRYIVFDDGSTDGSIEILKEHPKVDLRKWNRAYPDSYLISQTDWLNEAWQESRGCADWAVIVDIDEHLFAPQFPMLNLLERYKSQSITLVPALGFQMLSEDFPDVAEHLVQSRARGTPWPEMCKLSIINPNAIDESNFTGGRHTANAVGRLKLPQRDELLLLHYKYLGFERTLEKMSAQYDNMETFDANTGLLFHFGWSRQKLCDYLDALLKDSVDMSWLFYNPDKYPYFYRWWRLSFLYIIFRWVRRAKRFVREPIYMIKRLKLILSSRKYNLPSEKFGLFIEEINRSPIRKDLYQLIKNEGAGRNGGNTVVASKGKNGKRVLIHCQRSVDVNKLQDNRGVQTAIAAKEENEEKYQNEFETFVITNSKGFAKSAVELAKNHNIKLVSRNNLIEFISQV